MGSLSITHWLIFLAVIAIVFGTSKLKNIGKDIGGAVKDFKDAVKDETEQMNETSCVIDHQEIETVDESIQSKTKNNNS